mmetsp:Transcript_36398/g.102601  ORF Transcript_36398/g.102601 Transcript_36398/m.102601 type:complete len:315 (+) Transcript_36398:418-1362(+)
MSLTLSQCGGVSVRRACHVEEDQSLTVLSRLAERNRPESSCTRAEMPLRCACSRLAISAREARSHTRMDRSAPPDTRTSVPSSIVSALTSLVWPTSVFVEVKVSRLQILIVLSWEPEQRLFLAMVEAMHFTNPRCPGSVPMYWRLLRSQIMMSQSWEPVKSTSPTVQRLSTKPACPAKMWTQCSSGADVRPEGCADSFASLASWSMLMFLTGEPVRLADRFMVGASQTPGWCALALPCGVALRIRCVAAPPRALGVKALLPRWCPGLVAVLRLAERGTVGVVVAARPTPSWCPADLPGRWGGAPPCSWLPCLSG